MNILRRIFHPIMALIAIQLVWITVVVLDLLVYRQEPRVQ
jgi:hypothetical protein